MNTSNTSRCAWATNDLLIRYHDEEWGVPIHDDRLLFEFLILEGAQAGLSWQTVFQKRDMYREVFDNFDANKVACYSPRKITQLLNNPGIIRNRLKVHGAVTNAKAFLHIEQEFGSVDEYLWQFVNYRSRQNLWKTLQSVPCRTLESDAMSKALKHRGFTFVGTKICYAFMQAVGMVNDHTTNCFRHRTLR